MFVKIGDQCDTQVTSQCLWQKKLTLWPARWIELSMQWLNQILRDGRLESTSLPLYKAQRTSLKFTKLRANLSQDENITNIAS